MQNESQSGTKSTVAYSYAAKAASNALHEALSAQSQSIPGACRTHLQEALSALRAMRDLGSTATIYADILEIEIMLSQKTHVKRMVPKVFAILEHIDQR